MTMTDGKGPPTMLDFDARTLDKQTRSRYEMYMDLMDLYAVGEDVDLKALAIAQAGVEEIRAGARVVVPNLAPGEPPVDPTPRVAGTPAANQFGVFTVRPMGEARENFILRLLEEREIPPRGSLKAGGMEKHLDLFHSRKLGGKSASKLIDWLLSLDYKPGVPTERGATPKQLDFVVKEGARRLFDEIEHADVVRTVETATDGQWISFEAASAALDVLFNSPFVPFDRDDSKPELEAGIYTRVVQTEDGPVREFFKVLRAIHGSGRMYAKRLVTLEDATYDQEWNLVIPALVEFQMSRGTVSELTPDMRMSLAQAKEFGAIYGVCVRCGATLTKEESIEAGLGSVCITYFQ